MRRYAILALTCLFIGCGRCAPDDALDTPRDASSDEGSGDVSTHDGQLDVLDRGSPDAVSSLDSPQDMPFNWDFPVGDCDEVTQEFRNWFELNQKCKVDADCISRTSNMPPPHHWHCSCSVGINKGSDLDEFRRLDREYYWACLNEPVLCCAEVKGPGCVDGWCY